MAFVLNDRVKETTTTTGTGTVTLDGASVGYQSFSAGIGSGNSCYYAIVLGSEWETGIGTVGTGTLSRDTVLQSSNGDAKVNFSAGSKEVFVTYPADRSVYKETSGNAVQFPIWENTPTVSGNYSITNGNRAVSYGGITINTSSSVNVPTSSSWLIFG